MPTPILVPIPVPVSAPTNIPLIQLTNLLFLSTTRNIRLLSSVFPSYSLPVQISSRLHCSFPFTGATHSTWPSIHSSSSLLTLSRSFLALLGTLQTKRYPTDLRSTQHPYSSSHFLFFSSSHLISLPATPCITGKPCRAAIALFINAKPETRLRF